MTASEGRQPARPVKIAGAGRDFKKRFNQKSPRDRQAIERALRTMEQNLNTPSLRIRKVRGVDEVWEARASRSLRITFAFETDAEIWLRSNCTHDQVYRERG